MQRVTIEIDVHDQTKKKNAGPHVTTLPSNYKFPRKSDENIFLVLFVDSCAAAANGKGETRNALEFLRS